VERMSDGSTLISYGTGNPDVVEVRSDGSIRTSMTFAANQSSYRVIRQAYNPTVGVPHAAPARLALSAAVPNPFHATASLYLTLAHAGTVSLTVFDLEGRKVRDVLDRAPRGAGTYQVPVDLAGAPAGIYFARVTTEAGTASQRLVKID